MPGSFATAPPSIPRERTRGALRVAAKSLRYAALASLALVLATVGWCLVPLRSSMPRLQASDDTQYWTMARGNRIAFTHVAPGRPSDKPPIVFVHGGPGAYVHSTTVATIGRLAELGHDIYFYDQAGSGLSERLARPSDYSFVGHSDDLHEIVTEHIGARRVILIGQSFGGRLAAHFAAVHPELVDRLVLSSPAGIEPVRRDAAGSDAVEAKYPVPDTIVFTPPPGADPSGRGSFSGFPLRAVAAVLLATTLDIKLMSDAEADGMLDDLLEAQTAAMACDPSVVPAGQGGSGFYARIGSGHCRAPCDPRDRMAQMHAPVLVLQGLCDPVISYAMAYEYVDLFPDAEYQSFADAGHVIWWEQPEPYLARIEQFLSTPRDRAAGG